MDIEWMVWPFMAFKPVFNLVANPDVRLFWIYIASGLFIAYAWHRLSGNRERFASTFFAPDVWTSRSALNDYGILVLNPVILFALLSWALIHPIHDVAVAGAGQGALARRANQGDGADAAPGLSGTMFPSRPPHIRILIDELTSLANRRPRAEGAMLSRNTMWTSIVQ